MIKYYKYKTYKKYSDELWGYLINNYSFLNLKHKFLLKLQYFLKKNYFYKKKKWIRYKKFKFSRNVRRFNFAFIYYNKRRRWWIRKIIKQGLKRKKRKRYKIFRFIKFINFLLIQKNKLNYNFSFINIINNIYKKNYSYSLKNIKIKIKKINYIFFIKKYMKFYNYFKKLYHRKNFYRIKRKLKKTLKSDLKFEKQFFYSVHIIKPKPKIKKKKYAIKLKPIKLLSLFFGFKKLKKFKKIWNKKKLKKIININNFNKFLFFLESRIETFIFRINFFNSIYFIKQFIFTKNIFVNNMVIFRPDYNVKFFDIININYKYFLWLFKNIKYRIKNKFIFLNIPNYIHIDWALLTATIIRYPQIKQMNKPYKFLKYSFL